MDTKTAGHLAIPALGIGTWEMGGELKKDSSRDQEDILALQTALSLGITHIDTAEMYGNGHAEELVGEAIQSFPRQELFLTTKVKGSHLRRRQVVAACQGSLKRLKTDYIDLYLIHWPNPSVPLEETMQAMDSLVEQGLVRAIGVSNFSVAEMKEAQKHSKNKVAANEVQYSLLTRDKGKWASNMESEIIPHCQRNGMLVIAYTPLERGRLARPGYKLLDSLAKKYGKTQAQVSLNWLLSKKNVVAIPKAGRLEHIRENLGAVGWKLEKADILALDSKPL